MRETDRKWNRRGERKARTKNLTLTDRVDRHDDPEARPLGLGFCLPLKPLPAFLVDLLLEVRVAEVLGDFGAAGVDVLFFRGRSRRTRKRQQQRQ